MPARTHSDLIATQCALAVLVSTHFLGRTSVHFVGKCSGKAVFDLSQPCIMPIASSEATGVVVSVGDVAIEQAVATGLNQGFFAATGAAVRRVPGLHMARVLEAGPVMVPNDG